MHSEPGSTQEALASWRNVAMEEGTDDLAYALYASATRPPHPTAPLRWAWGARHQRYSAASAERVVTPRGLPSTALPTGCLSMGWRLEVSQPLEHCGRPPRRSHRRQFVMGRVVRWRDRRYARLYDRALSANEIQTDMITAVDPPPSDTTPPTVAISTPVNGGTVSGTVGVVATASDDVGVASVQFLLNGANLGPALSTRPYTTVWDTKTVSNGTYRLTAVARDFAGNANVSADVSVTVSNTDATAPNVTISTPSVGATVGGSIGVAATASDNVGIASVQFLLNGVNLGPAMTTAPFQPGLDTSPSRTAPTN